MNKSAFHPRYSKCNLLFIHDFKSVSEIWMKITLHDQVRQTVLIPWTVSWMSFQDNLAKWVKNHCLYLHAQLH